MAWTEPAIERVRVLWSEGASCSEIAKALAGELGMLTTKNAVIGIVHRRGLGAHQHQPPARAQSPSSPPSDYQTDDQVRQSHRSGDRHTTPAPADASRRLADPVRATLRPRRPYAQHLPLACRPPEGPGVFLLRGRGGPRQGLLPGPLPAGLGQVESKRRTITDEQ